MKRFLLIRFLALSTVLALSVSFAKAQPAPNTPGYTTNGSNWIADSPTSPHPVITTQGTSPWIVSGSFSAAGFAPAGSFATLTATNASASVALPNTSVAVFFNTGTTAVSCTLGVGSATAVAGQNIIQSGSWLALTVGTNTFGACIDESGSASNVVRISGGAGALTGAGGGSGGSGGSVTQGTSPWIVAGGGTAGAAASGVATVQGIASMVPLLTTSQGTGASGAALTGNPFRVGLSDGTNSQNWLSAIALADGVNGNNTGAVAPWLWNGASYDRAPGTTKGTYGIIRDAAGNARGANVNVSNQLSVSCDAGCGASGAVAQGSTTSGQSGFLMQGAVTTAAPSYTTAQTSPFSLDTAGNLRVNVITATGVTQGSATSGTTGSLILNQIGGLNTAPIGCASAQTYDASTNGLTQLVAASGSTIIYVCGYSFYVGGTATNVNLKSGDTGGACANSVAITPAYQVAVNGGIVDGSPVYRGLKTPAGKALCINTSAGNAVQGIVYYTQF